MTLGLRLQVHFRYRLKLIYERNPSLAEIPPSHFNRIRSLKALLNRCLLLWEDSSTRLRVRLQSNMDVRIVVSIHSMRVRSSWG